MHKDPKMRIYPAGIYLLKWKLSNKVCNLFKVNKRRHQNDLYWCHSGISFVDFENISQLFLVFHSWILGSVAGCDYQQRSKYRQVKIRKHSKVDVKYAVLTKMIELQHEKQLALNLKSLQSAGFKQKFTKFLRLSFYKNHFFAGKKV